MTAFEESGRMASSKLLTWYYAEVAKNPSRPASLREKIQDWILG